MTQVITLQQAIESGKSGMIQTGGEDNYNVDILREELAERGEIHGTDLTQGGHFFTHEEWAAYEAEEESDAANEAANAEAGCY